MTLEWTEFDDGTLDAQTPICPYPQGYLWCQVRWNGLRSKWSWLARVCMGNGVDVQRDGSCKQRRDAKRNAAVALDGLVYKVIKTGKQLGEMQ